MKANKNTKKSWLVYLSMVDINTNFEDKISRGSGENRSGSRAASVAGTGGTLYRSPRRTLLRQDLSFFHTLASLNCFSSQQPLDRYTNVAWKDAYRALRRYLRWQGGFKRTREIDILRQCLFPIQTHLIKALDGPFCFSVRNSYSVYHNKSHTMNS